MCIIVWNIFRSWILRKSYKAFTLFEILLAMLLMAIIAVAVLPGITKNAEQQLFVTQLKLVQNDLKQTMLILTAKNRGRLSNVIGNSTYNTSNPLFPQQGGKDGYPQNQSAMDNLTFAYAIRSVLDTNCVYFQGAKKDPGTDKTSPAKQAQLFAERNPHFITGKNDAQLLYGNGSKDVQPANFAALNLKTGATVRPIIIRDASNRICISDSCVIGALEVDLNGTKRPNVVGKDIHFFWIVNTDDGIVPWGENATYDAFVNRILNGYSILHDSSINNSQCNPSGVGKFNSVDDSLGCTYNVLRDGKITYY